MKSFAQFFGHLAKTMGASIVQFLITLCATPIMTRLYAPEAYAVFGNINTTASVLIGIGLLSLPNAYCAEKEEGERSHLLRIMVLLLIGLVLFAVAGVLLAQLVSLPQLDAIPTWSLLMLPVLTLTYGLRQIFVNMAIQSARFAHLSLSQVVEPLVARGLSIALGGGIGGNPLFILGAVSAGHLTAIRILRRHTLKQLAQRVSELPSHTTRFAASLRKYREYAIYNTVSQQAQPAAMLAIQMGITTAFSAHLAGQYILAVSILTLPVSLVALATAPVLYHHFIETEKNQPEQFPRFVILATLAYLLAGTLICLPVIFYGEQLFTIAFGQVWAYAGHIAGLLSLAYITQFALTGVQSVLMVTRRLKLQFMLEFGTVLPALLAATVCFRSLEFDHAILALSLIWLLRNGVLLCAVIMTAVNHSKPIRA